MPKDEDKELKRLADSLREVAKETPEARKRKRKPIKDDNYYDETEWERASPPASTGPN